MSDPATPYRVLARKYRPQTFAEVIGQEAMVRTLSNAIAGGRIAMLHADRGARGRQDDDGADHRPGAELHRGGRQRRADDLALRRLRPLPLDRRGPPCRRDRDGRRLAYRRR